MGSYSKIGIRLFQNYILNLSFMDAVLGANKDMCVAMETVCSRCNGRRAEPGSTLERCPRCNGSGEVRRIRFLICNMAFDICDRSPNDIFQGF